MTTNILSETSQSFYNFPHDDEKIYPVLVFVMPAINILQKTNNFKTVVVFGLGHCI